MANKYDLKEMNRNNIYHLIYNSNGISKQQIATQLGLSLPTVSQNLLQLRQEGLIMESGTFNSTGGRKPRIIQCVPDVRLALGMDITAHHLNLVLTDLMGTVLANQRLQLKYENTDRYYEQVREQLEAFVCRSGVQEERILGVGISLPAIIAADRRMITHMTALDAPEELYQRFAPYIPYPYLLFNDANSGGMAEFWHRDTAEQIVYISLSNSVGGSIVLSRQVYPGNDQRSGEFGHLTLVDNGRPCYCGQRGCANAYCNARLLSDMADGDLAQFFARVERGDAALIEQFKEYLHYLSMLVHQVRMCFDCDIILGGYVGSFLEAHLPELAIQVQNRDPYKAPTSYLTCSQFKLEAAALGAALYYVEQYIQQI